MFLLMLTSSDNIISKYLMHGTYSLHNLTIDINILVYFHIFRFSKHNIGRFTCLYKHIHLENNIFCLLMIGVQIKKETGVKYRNHNPENILVELVEYSQLTLTPTPRSFSKIAEKTPGTIVSKSQNSL